MSARYQAAKTVMDTRAAGMLEGALLDTFTASAMVAVYEAMNAENQAKFDTIPLDRLVTFIWKAVK